MESEPLISWLLTNLQETQNKKIRVRVKDIVEKYNINGNDRIKLQLLGKIIRKVFPNIKITYPVNKLTKKQETAYRNIEFKRIEDAELVSFDTIVTYLPKSSSILEHLSDKITFTIPSQFICNGNIVLKKVTIRNSKWNLFIREVELDLESLGLDDSFDSTIDCTKRILSAVDKLTICTGIPISNLSHLDIDPKSKNCFQECVSTVGDEYSATLNVRYKHCDQVLSWMAYVGSCSACQKTIRRNAPQEKALTLSNWNIEKIYDDKSKRKMSSHRYIQSLLEADSNFFQSSEFTRTNLLQLCSAYGVSARTNATKSKLVDKLGVIINAEGMANPDVFSKPSISVQKTGGTVSASSISVRGTAGTVSESFTSVPKTGGNVSRCETDDISGLTNKLPHLRAGKGKRKSSTNEGKGPMTKRQKHKAIKWPCGICKMECFEASVCCDSCDTWHHFKCLVIDRDNEELKGDKWCCPGCNNVKTQVQTTQTAKPKSISIKSSWQYIGNSLVLCRRHLFD